MPSHTWVGRWDVSEARRAMTLLGFQGPLDLWSFFGGSLQFDYSVVAETNFFEIALISSEVAGPRWRMERHMHTPDWPVRTLNDECTQICLLHRATSRKNRTRGGCLFKRQKEEGQSISGYKQPRLLEDSETKPASEPH